MNFLRRSSLPRLLFLLFAALAFEACASLPRVNEIPKPQTAPVVVGPKGELPPQKGAALLKKMEPDGAEGDFLKRHISLVESVGGSPLVTGNKVTLLVDGPATYQAMEKAIRGARDHINLDTYLFADDDIGKSFADLFLQKQAEGVQVNIIYDSVGCKQVSPSFYQRLRDAGVLALEFNPLNPVKARRTWLITERDHRKILVVDGKTAFTGGVNISDVYSEGSSGKLFAAKEKLPWRDTHVQIDGPAAAEFQRLFIENWVSQNGPDLPQRNYFPAQEKKGDDLVEVIGSKAGDRHPAIYVMYVSAILGAEKSIYLTNPYFAPDKQMVKALTDAARRGVDVRIVLPGSSDIGVIFFAGRSYYTHLLKAGVKLYERRGALLHAKTGVIDGVWSTIGSTNLEQWSFTRNHEVNTVLIGQDFASEMEALFTRDLEVSDEVSLDQWKKRSYREYLKEWAVRMFRRWL